MSPRSSVSITFSEPVDDFGLGDMDAAGGTLAGFAGSGTNYTVDLIPSGDGLLTVDVAGGSASDAAGNSNSPATQFSITFDATDPTVNSIARASGASTGGSSVDFTVTFAEPVIGVDSSDFALVASGSATGSISAISGANASYTVTVDGVGGDGTLGLNLIDDDSIADASGNLLGGSGAGNGNATGETYTVDQTQPSVAIGSSASSPTSDYPIALTFTFSEAVSGFIVGDVSVSGGTLIDFGGTGTDYTANLTPFSQGQVTVDIAAGVASDAAGNPNTLAPQFAVTYDGTAPVVTSIGRTSASPTAAASLAFAVNFSEPVAGVDSSDFVLALTGTATGTISTVVGSGATFTVTVSGINGDGTLGLNLVDDDSIVDTASNPLGGAGAGDGNFAGELYVIDHSGPSVTIDQAVGQADPVSSGPINFTVVFGEPVTGFESGDVSIGGTAGASSGTVTAVDATTYQLAVSDMTGLGTVTATIPAGVAVDALGNPNAASSSSDNSVTLSGRCARGVVRR